MTWFASVTSALCCICFQRCCISEPGQQSVYSNTTAGEEPCQTRRSEVRRSDVYIYFPFSHSCLFLYLYIRLGLHPDFCNILYIVLYQITTIYGFKFWLEYPPIHLSMNSYFFATLYLPIVNIYCISQCDFIHLTFADSFVVIVASFLIIASLFPITGTLYLQIVDLYLTT